MKRDMDLARRILLKVEEDEGTPNFIEIEFDDVDDEVVSYHVMLLAEAGLVDGRNLSSSSGFQWAARRLTWSGHDFLDSSRDPGIWKQAKDKLNEVGGVASMEVLLLLLKQLVKQKLGLNSEG